MKITVKLFASLRNGREKEQVTEIGERAAVQDLVKYLNIPMDQVAIIMINGRRAEIDAILEDEDTVAFFPPIGGG